MIFLGGAGQKFSDLEKRSKISEKKSNQAAKWNKKMGGRSFVITCGAFKDTLLHNLYSSPHLVRRAEAETAFVLEETHDITIYCYLRTWRF